MQEDVLTSSTDISGKNSFQDRPFFMSNRRWFSFQLVNGIVLFVLTPFAPTEAKKSYREYLEGWKKENGIDEIEGIAGLE